MNSNRKIFISFLIVGYLAVVLLTMANNSIYYYDKGYNVKLELDRNAKMIGSIYENCLVDASRDYCLKKLISTVNDGWTKGEILIKDNAENVILQLNKDDYKEVRSEEFVKYYVGSDKNQISIEVSRKISPPLYLSTWRSMTFSLGEVMNNNTQGFRYFLLRSINPMVFALMIFLLGFTYYRMNIKQQRLIQILESRIFRDSNKLNSTKEKILALVKERNDQLQEKDKINTKLDERSTYVKELEEELFKIMESQKVDLEADKAQISNMKGASTPMPKVEYVLNDELNFDLGFNSEDLKHAPTDHHGKEFVEKVFRAMKDDEVANRLVFKVTSGPIIPAKRGTVELRKVSSKYPTQNREGYLLDVFSEKEGFCAEVFIAPLHEWQAKMAAEYLVGTKGVIGKKLKLNFKV